jgi:hypothetical protein
MPDIRDLLDEVTTRTPPADPVGAVHRRIRSRARARNAGLAAAVALAVTATAAVALGGRDRTAVTPTGDPTPTPVWTKLDTSWRRAPADTVGHRTDDHSYDNLVRLVDAHSDAFFGFTTGGSAIDPSYTVALSADADADAWRRQVTAAVNGRPWHFVHCPRTAVHYDEVAGEVLDATWPSGYRLGGMQQYGFGDGVSYGVPCVVDAQLTSVHATAEDIAYAQRRWGDEVALFGRADFRDSRR